MKRKSAVRLGALGVIAAVALTTAIAGPALADPPAGEYKELVGVGSDTTDLVMTGLAGVIPAIGNYEATGTPTIKVSATGPTFTRPNGSTDGVKALTASETGAAFKGTVITGEIDFARSSAGPVAGGTDLTYIPFARDAVTYAVHEASDIPRNIPLGSATDAPTKFTLRNIYKCTVTSFTNASGQSVTLKPLQPQAGSGTRQFWDTTMGGVGPCVTDVNSEGTSVQEHKGDSIVALNEIAPISIAQYISQTNAATTGVDDRRGYAELGRVNFVKPIVLTGGKAALNNGFPINRLVYNVVPSADLGDAAIAATFVGTGSAVCSNAATIQKFGFGTLGTGCGTTTTKGAYRAP